MATTKAHWTQAIWRLVDRLVALLLVVAAAAVVFMMLHVTADVISRTVFGWSLPGTTLIVSKYYMVACAFLPLAYTEKVGQHISMDAISNLLSPAAQRFQIAAGYVFTAAVFGLLTYSAWLDAMKKFRLKSFDIEYGLQIFTWPSYFFLPLGCGAIALVVTARFLQYLTGNMPDMPGGAATGASQA